jgi:hypothetical protein
MFPGENPEAKSEGYRIAYEDAYDDFKKTGKVAQLQPYMDDYFGLNIGTEKSPKMTKVQVNLVEHLKNGKYKVHYTSEGKRKDDFVISQEQFDTMLQNHYED